MANKRWAAGTVKLEGLEGIVRELERRRLDVIAGVEAICDAGAEVVQDEVASRAPGSLAAATVRETTQRTTRRVTVSVGVTRRENHIARFVEFGTRAHVIRPRRLRRGARRALRVPGYGVYREVQHPGARKRPFIRPGFDASVGAATDAMGRKTRAVVRA